ncbi:MAG: TetR family transcriptional regulator [Ktedonobacterales bacterium]
MKNVLSPDERPRNGLRERKKAKTRAAIQQEALRLFREQGYESTTVEQIAAAVEVSPSTFFRYFPTKEEVVLYDDLDPLLIEAFEAQPQGLSPIGAMRGAMRAVFAQLSGEEMEQQQLRTGLIMTVPELRMRMLDQFVGIVDLLATSVGKRLGRSADDFEVRAFAGAIVGVLLATFIGRESGSMEWEPGSMEYYLAQMDAGLAYLEAGLPLLPSPGQTRRETASE